MVKNAPAQNHVSPGKLALIAVLALVLVAVLVLQYRGDGETPAVSLVRPSPPPVNSSQSPQSDTADLSDSNNAHERSLARRWPLIARDKVQEFNPFLPKRADSSQDALEKLTGVSASDQNSPHERSENSERSDAKAAERENRRIAAELHKDLVKRIDQHRRERRKALDDLLQSRVAMLLIEPRGNMALVDKKLVRVGDVVSGFLITEINPQGVVLVDRESEPE